MTFDRRMFLGTSFAGAAVALTGCGPRQEAEADAAIGMINRPYTGQLGVQLYTVRELFAADFRSTLDALAEIGFRDLEFAGYFEHDPVEIRAHMDQLGLMSRSSHVQLEQMQNDFATALETAEVMGQTNLILPWISEELRTEDFYREMADLLNTRGAEAQAAGKRIGYHNHEFEFDDLGDGMTGLDILIEGTDPELVFFEIDFFWTAEAGVDARELFAKTPGRFRTCHIKDRTTEGEMVSVGDGAIDFNALMAEAEAAGLEAFYVEHDNPADPLASVARSFAYLNA